MTDLAFAIRLTGDGRSLRGELRLSQEELRKVGRGASEAGTQMDRAGRETTRLGDRLRGLNRSVIGLQGALGGLVTGLALRELVRSAVEWERYERTLQAVTGSAAGAAAEMQFVEKLADRLGLAVNGLAGDYSKLFAAAKGTAITHAEVREVFTAVSEASTVLGLSSAETSGALTALQQIISKGKVSAEELRQQLGERLPGAFQIAARSMGVTTAELDEMLSRGELLAEDFIPRFAHQMRSEFAGSAEDAATGAAANFRRFESAVFDLKRSFGESLLPTLSTFASWMASTLLPAFAHLGERMGIIKRDIKELSLGEVQLRIADAEGQLEAARRDASLGLHGVAGIAPGQDAELRAANAASANRVKIIEDELRTLRAREKETQEIFARQHFNTKDLAALGYDPLPPTPPPAVTPSAAAAAPATKRKRGAGSRDEGARVAREQAKADREAASAKQELADAAQRVIERLDPMLALERQYNEDLHALAAGLPQEQTDLYTESVHKLQQEFISARRELDERLHPMLENFGNTLTTQQAQIKDQSEALRDVAKDLGLTFTSAFEEAALGGKSFREILKGIGDDIARLVLRKGVTEPLLGALDKTLANTGGGGGGVGGFLGSLFGSIFGEGEASLFHGGGLVGSPGPRRRVSPLAFIGAPRMHGGGLAGDEVPAILQRGETVLPRGTAPVTVVYSPTIQAVDTRTGLEFLASHRDALVGMVNDAFNRRGTRGPVR